MSSVTSIENSVAPITTTRKAIIAATLGNTLEWFDFAVYAFFAVTISKLFFQSGNETVSLLAAVATFGVGFVMRPVGAQQHRAGLVRDRRGATQSKRVSRTGGWLDHANRFGRTLAVIDVLKRRSDCPERLN